MAKKKLTQRKKDEETEQEDTVEDKPLEETEQESEQKSTEGTAADEISSEESDETEQNEPASTRTFTSVPKRVTSPVSMMSTAELSKASLWRLPSDNAQENKSNWAIYWLLIKPKDI